MKFLVSTLFVLCFYGQCKAQKANVNEQYPSEIIKLGLQKQYDAAKWYMYCIHCDENLQYVDSKPTQKTFGTLPLEFDRIVVNNDTTEIDFFFIDKGRKVDMPDVINTPYWGVVFKGRSATPILFSLRAHIRYRMPWCNDLKKCPKRELVPLQPEVVNYIKQNRAKLHPWFRNEAIKRGVIKE